MKLLAFNETDLHSNLISTTILSTTFGRKRCVLDLRKYSILLFTFTLLEYTKQKWKGGQSGTYLRQTSGIVGFTGERRKT